MENSELITKALNYINKEFRNGDMTIENVAENAGFSTNYFNKVFLAHTGFSVMEYIRFSRMKYAAVRLRTSDISVIDLALDCGYETHESFTRAFRKQYGVSPTEYRKAHEKTVMWYGDFNNETVGHRIMHEFCRLKSADPDEVREFLLEKDALKWGYEAVTTKVNGGAALYLGEDFRNGFVWFYEIDGKFWGDIISDDFAVITEYLKLFSDERFEMCFFSLDDPDAVSSSLVESGVNVSGVVCFDECFYTGEPYELKAPDGISIRELHYEDLDLIKTFFEAKRYDTPMFKYYERELYKRDVMKSDETSELVFGVFFGEEMAGMCFGQIQSANGFVLNNCVDFAFIDDKYKSDELCVYGFKYVTNAALEKGVLPFDDVQTPRTKPEDKYGSFNSVDIGYKLVNRSYHVKR